MYSACASLALPAYVSNAYFLLSLLLVCSLIQLRLRRECELLYIRDKLVIRFSRHCLNVRVCMAARTRCVLSSKEIVDDVPLPSIHSQIPLIHSFFFSPMWVRERDFRMKWRSGDEDDDDMHICKSLTLNVHTYTLSE